MEEEERDAKQYKTANIEKIIEFENKIITIKSKEQEKDIYKNMSDELKNNINDIKKQTQPELESKPAIAIKKELANLTKLYMDINEELYRVPAILVKIRPGGKQMARLSIDSDSTCINILDPKSLNANLDAKTENEANDGNIFYKRDKPYGPFKKIFISDTYNPIQKPDSYTSEGNNKHIFDYLNNTFNIFDRIKDGDKNFTFFGYGGSGSGKTFTLLQGAKPDKNVIDPNNYSLLSYIISHLKSLKEPEHELKLIKVEVEIFYPLHDYDINDTTIFHCNKTSDISNDLQALNGILKNDIVESAESDGEKISRKVLEFFDNDLLPFLNRYGYVMPTSNNPESSRAFTIFKIFVKKDLENPVIKIVDLPGIEKKSDMLKDYFFKNTSYSDIQRFLSNDNMLKIYKSVPNIDEKSYIGNSFPQPFNNYKSYVQTEKIEKISLNNKIKELDSKIEELDNREETMIDREKTMIEKTMINREKKMIQILNNNNVLEPKLFDIYSRLVSYLNFNYIDISNDNNINNENIKDYNMLYGEDKSRIGYKKRKINNINDIQIYTLNSFKKDFFTNESKVLDEDKFKGTMTMQFDKQTKKFTITFDDPNNKDKTISESLNKSLNNLIFNNDGVYSDSNQIAFFVLFSLFLNIDSFKDEKIYTIDFNLDANTKAKSFTTESCKLGTLILEKNPVITFLKIMFDLIDISPITKELTLNNKPILQLFFLTPIVKFLLKQGGEIVSSLEHLLYIFLKNKGDNEINTYNQQYPKKQFGIKGDSYENSKYVLDFNITKNGMKELVKKKPSQGMNTIFNTQDNNQNNRFISIIAAYPEFTDDNTKRIAMTHESFEFAEILTAVSGCKPNSGGGKVLLKLKNNNTKKKRHKQSAIVKKRLLLNDKSNTNSNKRTNIGNILSKRTLKK